MSTFTPQQEAAITARGNLLIVAGAGTGKTRTLIERCLRLLTEGVSLEEILMVTFTEAAAAEMRGRLRAKLRELHAAQPDRGHLAEQLALIDMARISTLHSFCLQLAREHFHELGLDPQFSVLDEQQTRPLKRGALDDLLEQHYSGADAASRAVRELIRAIGRGADDRVRQLVLQLHAHSQSLPDPARWLQKELERFEQTEPGEWHAAFSKAVTSWRREWMDQIRSSNNAVPAIKLCLEALQNLSAPATEEEAAQCLRGVLLADDKRNWPNGTIGRVRDPLRKFFEQAKFLGSLLPDDNGNDPIAQDWEWVRHHVTALVTLTGQFTEEFTKRKRELGGVDFADLEQYALRLLRDPDTGSPTVNALAWRGRLKQVFVDEYQDINEAQDAILTALAKEGVEGNRFIVGDVKQSIYRFRLANPGIFRRYQNEWHLKTAPEVSVPVVNAKTGKRRKASTEVVTPLLPGLDAQGKVVSELGRGTERGGTFPLTGNFRSRAALLDFINPFFAHLMREEIGGVHYEPLQFGNPEGRAHLSAQPGDPPAVELHLIARTMPEAENDDSEGTKENAEEAPDLLAIEREARLIARRLREMKEEKRLVWNEDKQKFCEAEWRDMAVLMRSPKGRAETLAMEFSKAGVPLAAARDGFFTSLEVSDLLSLLKLLDNPLQDVPLLAVLRSPLVAMSLEELAEVRASNPAKPFWTALARWHNEALRIPDRASEPFQKVDTFLRRYERWRELVRQTSLTQCLETTLVETQYEAFLQAGERGVERTANVRRLLDLAREFDPYQRQGLYRFLQFVQSQEEEDLDLQPASSPTGDAVQLLSIHRSKGLEFPIVVLAGMGTRFNERDLHGEVLLNEKLGLCPRITPPGANQSYPSLTHWLARRAERRELRGEELRLLYVALTRARDVLILVGTATQKVDAVRWESEPGGPLSTNELVDTQTHLGWLRKWLPHATAGENWTNSQEGKNKLLRWRIYDENDNIFSEFEPRSDEGAHRTDPSLDEVSDVEKLKLKLAWQYHNMPATTRAAKTSVSELRRRATEERDEKATAMFEPAFRRPVARVSGRGRANLSAADRGIAHHAFLQLVELSRTGSKTELRSEAERLQKIRALTSEQIAILDFPALGAFWQSETGRQIRAQIPSVQRELKFTARFAPAELDAMVQRTTDAGWNDEFVVVQGVADLVVVLPKELWLLDFKTDEVKTAEVNAKARFYEPQLKLYARALSQIFRRPVSWARLHFLSCGQTQDVPLN